MSWTRAENLVCEELDNGALLVNPSTRAMWGLNEAAAALWKRCEGSSTAELASVLARPLAEIEELCRQFAAHGLLSPRLAGAEHSALFSSVSSGPAVKLLGLGSGPRRRPGPRGISGPA